MKRIFKNKFMLAGVLAFSLSFSYIQFIDAPVVKAGYQDEARAAYNLMPNRLPSGQYRLLKNSDNSFASTEYCRTNPDSCYASAPYDSAAGSTNHQYMTVAGTDNINDLGGGQSSSAYKYAYVAVYAGDKADKDLSFIFVDRRRNLDCETALKLTYFTNSPTEAGAQTAYVRNPSGSCGTSVIPTNQLGTPRPFPQAKLAPLSYKDQSGLDQWTGLYKGYVKIELAENFVSQASFTVGAPNGGRLGYKADSWLNMYPTAIADRHTMIFRWRPPCNATENTDIYFDDGDEGTSAQPNNALLRVIEQIPSSSNPENPAASSNRTEVARRENVTSAFFSISNTGGRSYSAEFSNINGGNGIGFTFPYDSGDFYIPCPPPPPPPGADAADCNTYRKNLVRDGNLGAAFYRFTVYSGNAGTEYRASGPANGSRRSTDSGRTGWATYNQAPVYQTGWWNNGYKDVPDSIQNSANEREIKVGQAGSDSLSSYSPGANPYDHNINFPEPMGPDWVVYLEKWDHSADRNNNGSAEWEYRYVKYTYADCYQAACDVLVQNSSGLPANSVKGGQVYDTAIRIYNTGRDTLPVTSRGAGLSGTVPPGNSWPAGPRYASAGIGPPTDRANPATWPYVDIPMPKQTAPASVTTFNLSAYPDYYGLFVLGPNCSKAVNVYMQFNITPIAYINSGGMDSEDPREITYTTGGNNTGWTVTVDKWNGKLIRKRAGTVDTTLKTTYDGPYSFENVSETRTYGSSSVPLVPGTLQPGDKVCAYSYITPTDGWVGPGGDKRLTSTKGPPQNPAEDPCETIYDRPYLRTYGADVMAGGGFASGGVCNSSGSSGIFGYRSTQSDRGGSGAQFAALALGSIDGFMTASLRTSVPKEPNGLTIANTPSLGGYNGAICATDFFNEKKYEVGQNRKNSPATSLEIKNNNLENEKQTVFNDGGGISGFELTINENGSTTFNNRHTVFVDGDVVIKNNIKLKDDFDDPLLAPAFALVVRGNIYIQGNVDRLDGMYVAQKRLNDTGGTIFTCSNDDTPYDPNGPSDAAMLAACSKQLKVNGMFVADTVKLLRTIYSLRDSFIDERSATPCTPSVRNKLNSCAAEVFNFIPEIFLSPPPFYEAPPKPSLDSYETLPPIL
ncbi:hypothetical protein KY385_03945 [Candidatus Parcubacteria bacterium]|nr:hypothetical protein [Candidatus Parcubacteria bacterium]